MNTHQIPIDGYTLYIRDQGEGPTLVFGHSLTFDSTMFDAQVEALGDRFRLIRIDLHGHGKSGHPLVDHSLDAMATDLGAVLDHLGIETCGYIGHSMGGMVGMRYVLDNPGRVRRLALLNTSASEEDPTMRALFHQVNEDSRGKPTHPDTVDFVLRLMFSAEFITANPQTVAPFQRMLAEPPEGDGIYFTAKAVIWRNAVLDRLSAIDVPTLVMTSESDTSVPAIYSEQIAAAIPSARLVNLRGSGHITPVERTAEVNDALALHFAPLGSQR